MCKTQSHWAAGLHWCLPDSEPQHLPLPGTHHRPCTELPPNSMERTATRSAPPNSQNCLRREGPLSLRDCSQPEAPRCFFFFLSDFLKAVGKELKLALDLLFLLLIGEKWVGAYSVLHSFQKPSHLKYGSWSSLSCIMPSHHTVKV